MSDRLPNEVLFYKTELRTLWYQCSENIDTFLDMLANDISSNDTKCLQLKRELDELKHQVRLCRNGDMDISEVYVD